MNNKYISAGCSIDLDKLRYDIAMTYALQKTRSVSEHTNQGAPDFVDFPSDMLTHFGKSYSELCNLKESYLISLISGGTDN